MDNPSAARGRVLAVRGNVVDVRFEASPPPRFRALRAGDGGEVVLDTGALLETPVGPGPP